MRALAISAASESALATPRYGYELSAGCVFTPIDDTGLYFDPENRQRLCAVPPEFEVEAATAERCSDQSRL